VSGAGAHGRAGPATYGVGVSETECRIPTVEVGLEPCPRCGGEQVWVTSHSQCVRCRWITPCCEGAALPLRESSRT
jgi:hypothetical protein